MNTGNRDTKAPEKPWLQVSGAFLHKESVFIRLFREPFWESHSGLGIRRPEIVLTAESIFHA